MRMARLLPLPHTVDSYGGAVPIPTGAHGLSDAQLWGAFELVCKTHCPMAALTPTNVFSWGPRTYTHGGPWAQ